MNERGMTITELLVALTVLAIVLGGVFTLQQQGQLAYLMGSARVEVQQNARVALELMVSELRSALSVTAVAGCDVGCSDITFVDQNSSTVRYQKTSATLNRTCTGGAPPPGPVCDGVTAALIAGVQALTFKTFDVNGVATAVAANVVSVSINIQTIPEDTSASYAASYQQATLDTRVRLRNL